MALTPQRTKRSTIEREGRALLGRFALVYEYVTGLDDISVHFMALDRAET